MINRFPFDQSLDTDQVDILVNANRLSRPSLSQFPFLTGRGRKPVSYCATRDDRLIKLAGVCLVFLPRWKNEIKFLVELAFIW